MCNWFQAFYILFALFMLYIFLNGGPPKPQPEYVRRAKHKKPLKPLYSA